MNRIACLSLITTCLLGGACLDDPGFGARSAPAALSPSGEPALAAPSPAPPARPPDDTFYTFLGHGQEKLPAHRTAWEEQIERLAAIADAKGQSPGDKFSIMRAATAKLLHITLPPKTKNFRTPAEYEASQAYLLNWRAGYTGTKWIKLFTEIIKGAWGEVPVVMVRSSSSQQKWIEMQLNSIGLTYAEQAKNIRWWTAKSNAIWARDFAPVSIVETGSTGKEKLSFIDYKYYYTRPLDDSVPTELAKAWGINVYRPDLSFEGGNFQTTSDGLCSVTKGVNYYNLQYSQSAIEQILKEYQGCKKVLFVQPMTGGVIAHIDMFSKFGSDDHMLMGEYTATQHSGNKLILDANAKLFLGTKTPSGKSVKVTRIPMPDIGGSGSYKTWRTYTNSLSLTDDGKPGVVLIPTFDDETTYEAAAMAAYAKVFPGWKLVKIDSKVIIPGQGAIHCITMQIPKGVLANMEPGPGNMCGVDKTRCHQNTCGAVTAEGCCSGDTLKYCDKGKVRIKDCFSKPYCGWDPSNKYYACGMQGKADPSGKYPQPCPLSNNDAGPPSEAGPDLLLPDGPAVDAVPDQQQPDQLQPDTAAPDLPVPDVGVDASGPDGGSGGDDEDEGCDCAAGGGTAQGAGGPLLLLLGLLGLARRRRR